MQAAEYGTCAPEIFNRLFKVENREQKKFLLAHRRSHRKVPYSADWFRGAFFIFGHHIHAIIDRSKTHGGPPPSHQKAGAKNGE